MGDLQEQVKDPNSALMTAPATQQLVLHQVLLVI